MSYELNSSPGISGVGKNNSDDSPMSSTNVMSYCIAHSTPQHPVELKLQEETAKHPWAIMMGATEVVRLNATFIRAMGAKKVLDIGVFTGASSLSACLALPEDGYLLGCDTNEEYSDIARSYWKEAGVEEKVKLVIAPATETLTNLVDKGESFDFAFIDADKINYDNYYELCLSLLRKGGVMSVDNTLYFGRVLNPADKDDHVMVLKELNEKIAKDGRVWATQFNIGDGLTLAVKL